jgi:hypothetical protein
VFELIGGVISVVIGIVMLIVSGAIINTVSIGGTIGDCNAQDYNGDGTVNATDQDTTAFTNCNGTRNNGYTILNIISVVMIVGGVVTAIRGI